jgi:hypothetical protein
MIVVNEEIDIKFETNPEENTINILTICTGKYFMFFDDFYQSCESNFLTNYKKKYFVFTDGELNHYDNVVKIYQPKLGWPYDTMMRFKMFNSIENLLDGDYIYFFNINMSFLEKVGEEVIPREDNDYLMGVNHPGFYNQSNFSFTYERRPTSKFYIPLGKGKKYYQGCFNGGRRKEFISMSKELEELIDYDLSKDIIPVWHDESALNWYYCNRNPLMLNPSYAYPESLNIPFDKKIIQIDKSKLGGHVYLRN